MENKILVVANWKANAVDVDSWIKGLVVSGQGSEKVEIAIAASYTLIPLLTANRYPLTASLASQDLSLFPPGAYTGEIPASMLTNLGVKYALLGHSERRKNLGETTEMVGKKLEIALAAGITPIICAQTQDEIPNNIRNFEPAKYLIMYEPAAAISTDGNYHPDSIENIQHTLTDWKTKLPSGIKFLYGGSVSPENISSFNSLLVPSALSLAPLLSGFVIGHASLDPKSFSGIIDTLCSLPA